MIFAVLDPSPLTVCINCSFLHLYAIAMGQIKMQFHVLHFIDVIASSGCMAFWLAETLLFKSITDKKQ